MGTNDDDDRWWRESLEFDNNEDTTLMDDGEGDGRGKKGGANALNKHKATANEEGRMFGSMVPVGNLVCIVETLYKWYWKTLTCR